MTNEEKFIFDLDGYILIKNVLSKEEVAELNRVSDERFAYKEGENRDRRSRVIDWGQPFLNLIDHPNLLPYLVELLGPRFRLDHEYCIFMQPGAGGGGLHGGEWGGPFADEGDHWYRYKDGLMRNGLTVVTFFAASAAEGDCGFVCVPGTHKSNFLGGVPQEVLRHQRAAHYVRQPAVEAGDALIFTEALMHGTLAWKAKHERRAFLYKYSPGYSAWGRGYYDTDTLEGLTEQQKRILLPPFIGGRPPVVEMQSA